MRYVLARSKQNRSEKAYRIYLTQCLQAIANNTCGGDKRTQIQISYEDFLKKLDRPLIKQSGEEIAKDVIERLGLKFGET